MRGRSATLLASALLALAGCTRDAADRQSYVERAVALAPEIERATGLRFKSPPRVEVRSREQVREFLTRELSDSATRRDVAAMTAAYRRLGLIADTTELTPIYQRLYEEQIVGYYDPRNKMLYVVQGADSAAADVTLRHEMVHALQDQYVNVDSLLRLPGDNDRQNAVHAALEGQATYAQYGAREFAARFPGGWDRVREVIRQQMDNSPSLAQAPFIVREGALFPYLSGAEHARRVASRYAEGAGDSLLARLPASTEQVLHGESFFGDSARKPDAPTAVTLPAPRAGTVASESTLGEFEMRMLLYHHLQDLGVAAQASRGWDGDRFAVVRTPQGEAFVWLTVWDAQQDAAEFYDAIAQIVPKRYPAASAGEVPRGAGPTARTFAVNAGDGGGAPRTVLVRALDVAGRSAVLYVDAPAAAGVDVVDVGRATLRD
jgi:hypothetical protein